MDVTTTSVKPQTFSGLDIQTSSGTPCATWTMTFVSNSSGRPSTDFTSISANTPEGSTAVTPQVASGGQGNLAGDYVWNVSCKDASNNSSNTVTLTYHTVTAGGAGVVTLGNTDRLDFGGLPSTFGNVAGAEIQFATGGDWHATDVNIRFKSGAFTNQVLIKVADNTRRPYMSNVKGGGNMANYRVTDFVLSGSIIGVTNAVTGAASSAGSTIHDAVFDNIHYYGSEPMLGNNSAQASVTLSGCTSTCGITNSSFDYVESGSAPKSNTYIRSTTFRYIYNNCLFLTSVDSVEFSDVSCMSPMQRYQGQHPDNMQIADGATPSNIVIQRFLEAQADGDYFAQGAYFGGSLIKIPGYVSAGSGSTSPGSVFTKTSGTVGSSWQGSRVVIPGVIAATDNVTIDCPSHVCSSSTTSFTLINLASTNIGSSGSPVTLYGAGTISFQMSGILSSTAGPYGTSTNANTGTSWVYDYDFAPMDTQNPLISSFTGSVASALLTATTTAVSNVSGNTGFISGCGRINTGSGYTFNGSVISKASGSDLGPGTYNLQGSPGNVSAQTIQCSGAYPGQTAPDFQQSNCNVPEIQTGSYNIDRGYYASGMHPHDFTSGCTVGVNFPAPNTTFGSNAFGATSVAFGYTPPGGNLTSADYASGMLPKDYLAAHPFSASDTNADILRINCLANKGKIGGKKDLGGGAWASSVTGETNAGTHTGGGDWIIYNGTSHVTSTHITGCEAAP